MRVRVVAAGLALVTALSGVAVAQRQDALLVSRDHPALDYSAAPLHDAVVALNARLKDGTARLAFDPATGYLKSLLAELQLPVTSQVLVYSKTSQQAPKISERTPRALYFNDTVSVGYIAGADVLEVAVQDPRQGSAFYTLAQTDAQAPELRRGQPCLSCHLSWDTRAVPGRFLLTSHPRRSENDYTNGGVIDHRDPFPTRWGGWYVTGAAVPPRHMGNVPLVGAHAKTPDQMAPPPKLANVADRIDTSRYLSAQSDVVALLVLEHQLHAMNLITRAGWEHRVAVYDAEKAGQSPVVAGDPDGLAPRVREAADELADYLLFVDETPLPVPVAGSSGFAEWFAAQGPRDAEGRSLREFDLRSRLMKYPLSYVVYSEPFGALPAPVRTAVLRRVLQVLAGEVPSPKYAHLTKEKRQVIAAILKDTLRDLPPAPGVTRP